MKKVIFSAAAFGMVAVSGMALAPTSAEAIPAFARQTGAACLSCHFQTFPALKAFGRAFKRNSFTDVGDEALVEDDNLSIPAVLNATVVIRGDYTNSKFSGVNAGNLLLAQTISGLPANATALNANTSVASWNIPSETPILIAGRLGANTGAFVEFANGGTNGGGATTGPAASQGGVMSVGNWQLLNSWDVGDFKVGLGAHNSSFGGSAVFETSNVFGQHSGKLGGGNLSAIQNIGFANATLGVGAWVGNDMGDIQLALIAPSGAQGTNVGGKLAKLVRGHLFLDAGGWDTMIGFGFVTGTAGKPATTPGGVGEFKADLKFVDFQAQGEVGDMSIGVYADYAIAKDKTNGVAGVANMYNVGAATGDKTTGYSARVEVKPLENVGVGIGIGSLKNTHQVGNPDKASSFQVAAFYEVYQNLELNLIYNSTKYTPSVGTSWKKNDTILEFEGLL